MKNKGEAGWVVIGEETGINWEKIAQKLHRQFAQSSKERLKKLISEGWGEGQKEKSLKEAFCACVGIAGSVIQI